MPNKCISCGKMHPDDADYLLSGCDVCGSKFFFYVPESRARDADKSIALLSKSEMKEIEGDVRDILKKNEVDATGDKTVILDLEAVRVVAPGKYEIDIINLFNQRPIVIKVGTGKYEIDLSSIAVKFGKK